MYISLHNHSHYSTLDGYQTVPEMVSRAKELGYHSLALTDHGTMRGIIDFYEECHKQEIKPIIGCEFYFCETPEIRDRSLTYHLVLLAKNDIGYHNIKLLDSESYREENFFFNGRLPLDYLREHSEGLICLTACMAGVLNSDKADWWMQTLQEIFPENLYAEIQPLNIPEQQEYNAKVIGLARKYEVPLVVTTDAHYAIKADKEYHSLWTGIKGVQYHDDENYLWSKQEIMETAWIPDDVKDECIVNTEEIAKQCNVTIEMGGNHYPDYPVANPANKIREICRGTWKDKVPKGKYKEYAERFESEMIDLEKAGYLNYLLVIWDMLKHCIEKGIPIGEGRGSASGSLVGYLMDIHKVDPIVRGTEFFRFCNPYRVSPCDIDTDVSTVHRGEIIDYVKERYGYICKIMTIGYTKNPEKHEVGKAAVQRAGQALKLEAQALKRLVKGIELDMNEILMSTEFDEETRERLYDVAQHFSYRLHKIGIHASAILVTPDEIENYTPLEGCYSTDVSTGERKYIQAAAYTYHQLEAMGCLKLDILGLGTLDVIEECLQSTGMTMADIPLDDEATYKTYADGNLLGVFQMESSGMTRTAQQLGVSNFDDIAALVALFRPGPIYSGMLQQYIDGKNGKKIEYPCEVVKKLTENTYGVLVYQEQVMKIAMEMAGYTLGQADVLRKVIGRKEVTKIDKAVEEFIMACKEQNYDESIAKPVAEQIRAAGAYIFNKSHSVGYSQLSYKTAYLKTHYPVPYMCALINSKSKQEDVQKYIPELNRLAIQLLPPDYSTGNLKWQVEGKAIRIGLNYIKGVGKALRLGATTWEQFITTNNKTICTALIKAGAMDFLGKDRGWMLANLEDNAKKLAYMEKCKERIEFYTEQGKASGVTMWKKKLSDTVMLNDSGKGYDIAKGEMEVLRLTFHTVPKILVGIASAVQEFEDKNKKVMARIIFDTDYGEYKCVVFASQWKQETRRGRYGKVIRGITIEQGKTYEFIQKDGVISDCREYRCKYKQV